MPHLGHSRLSPGVHQWPSWQEVSWSSSFHMDLLKFRILEDLPKKATLFRVRDSRAWQHSFQWIRGNIFSVYFLIFFCWCGFQSLPSSTSSSIRGREPSRRSTSRWVWRLSRRWRSSCQMKWSTPEPAFGRWETLKAKAFSVLSDQELKWQTWWEKQRKTTC